MTRISKILSAFLALVLIAWGIKASVVAVNAPRIAFSITYDSFGSKPSGPVIVGWDDGLIVFALNPDSPGQDMQCGRITPVQVTSLISELKDAGFFTPQMVMGAIPDNSTTTMTAGGGELATHTWNEALSTSWGAHIASDSRLKQFTKMWALSRHAITFAYPATSEPLSNNPEALKRFENAKGSRWRATAANAAAAGENKATPANAANSPIPIPIDHPDARYVLVGSLNKPLGELLTLQGLVVEDHRKAYRDIPSLKVQRINGEPLKTPIQIPISPYFGDWGSDTLPKISTGKTLELEGYETGSFVGIPAAAYKLGGIELQTSDHHFSSTFHVVRGKAIDPIQDAPTKPGNTGPATTR